MLAKRRAANPPRTGNFPERRKKLLRGPRVRVLNRRGPQKSGWGLVLSKKNTFHTDSVFHVSTIHHNSLILVDKKKYQEADSVCGKSGSSIKARPGSGTSRDRRNPE